MGHSGAVRPAGYSSKGCVSIQWVPLGDRGPPLNWRGGVQAAVGVMGRGGTRTAWARTSARMPSCQERCAPVVQAGAVGGVGRGGGGRPVFKGGAGHYYYPCCSTARHAGLGQLMGCMCKAPSHTHAAGCAWVVSGPPPASTYISWAGVGWRRPATLHSLPHLMPLCISPVLQPPCAANATHTPRVCRRLPRPMLWPPLGGAPPRPGARRLHQPLLLALTLVLVLAQVWEQQGACRRLPTPRTKPRAAPRRRAPPPPPARRGLRWAQPPGSSSSSRVQARPRLSALAPTTPAAPLVCR